MARDEMAKRQAAAVKILRAAGWTERNVDRFMEQQPGQGDDQVEALEREAANQTFTPVQLTADFCVYQRAPVCGMTYENAVAYARQAWPDDAGVECDNDSRELSDVTK